MNANELTRPHGPVGSLWFIIHLRDGNGFAMSGDRKALTSDSIKAHDFAAQVAAQQPTVFDPTNERVTDADRMENLAVAFEQLIRPFSRLKSLDSVSFKMDGHMVFVNPYDISFIEVHVTGIFEEFQKYLERAE